ncbi:MAG: hypothetical protein HQL18_01585 [Candidatus Omnitrophica bacterium]|nr:hypothetical protein [Candidatus Omnitrophota bacterium]
MIVFLTTRLSMMRQGTVPVYDGQIMPGLPQGGAGIEFIDTFAKDNLKTGPDGKPRLPSLEDLLAGVVTVMQEGESSEAARKAFAARRGAYEKMVNDQGEPGVKWREMLQNAIGAGATEVLVRHFRNEGYIFPDEADLPTGTKGASVSEVSDNGRGQTEAAVLAFLVEWSTKPRDGESGRFGSGAKTVFSREDVVEIEMNNGKQAYKLTVLVNRDTGAYRLLKAEAGDPQKQPHGVKVRMISALANVIPELEKFQNERHLKVMAGMVPIVQKREGREFQIMVEDLDGNPRPLEVKGVRLLSELKFKEEVREEVDGKMVKRMRERTGRIWSVKDKNMPTQFIDANGLRITDVDGLESLLALIPAPLQEQISNLGMIIQLPVLLTINRDRIQGGLENEAANQVRVATLFYRALAFKSIQDPGFRISGMPTDFEGGGERYWKALAADAEPELVRVANTINSDDLDKVSVKDLEQLRDWFAGKAGGAQGALDKTKFVSFLAHLEVWDSFENPQTRTSLLAARLYVYRKELSDDLLGRMGVSREQVESFGRSSAADLYQDLAPIQEPKIEVIPWKDWNADDLKFMFLARFITGVFGFNDVILASMDTARGEAVGNFFVDGGRIYLKQRLSANMSAFAASGTDIHEATEVTIHELAHLIEFMVKGGIISAASLSPGLYYSHTSEGGIFNLTYRKAALVLLDRLGRAKKPLADYFADLVSVDANGVESRKLDQPGFEALIRDALSNVEPAPEFVAPAESGAEAAPVENVQETVVNGPSDAAAAPTEAPGGIDLTAKRTDGVLETRGDSAQMSFNIDPAELQRLERAPGLVPVSMTIQPLKDFRLFLGLRQESAAASAG